VESSYKETGRGRLKWQQKNNNVMMLLEKYTKHCVLKKIVIIPAKHVIVFSGTSPYSQYADKQ